MNLRKAKVADVENIHALINHYAQKGLMLARSRSMLYEFLREFIVVEENGVFLGTGGLHIIWEDLAEIRALAVVEEAVGRGIGHQIVGKLIEEAGKLGIPRVFALTYQKDFFIKCGFKEIPKETLSTKVWKECINCPKFPNCDEIAVILETNSDVLNEWAI
ncbi:MAG TPA: N-acetyltransferase [Firmicutes bacterium]|nr:N-acetyltransferase [Bacillota bacterium]HBK67244.1 N-acetyltransferase [Bacillota bacterium]HBT16876.1 N-acetyltransferase [Bacillota bacterium]